jgi:SHS2 domain-containing protein
MHQQFIAPFDIYQEAYETLTTTEATETILKGTITGKPVTGLSLEIKAVTYHELSISYHHTLWHALITFDI